MNELSTPKHIAIIMDGNGRWAKAKNVPKLAGHKSGADAARKTTLEAAKLGVKYLTLYTFSSENWQRPEEEVFNLMTLLRHYLKSEAKTLHKNNVKVTVIGNKDKLDSDIRSLIIEATELTKNNTGLHLILALSYGAREEITQAAKRLAQDYKDNKIDLEQINSDEFASYLYTTDIPDPDLLIRTSGEMRISNFLIWQCAYTEFYFTNVLWPDFTENDFRNAIVEFNKRERRYGK